MKKFISTLLVLMFCFAITASATSVPEVANELPRSTINEIDSMFHNKKSITILDVDGNDITKAFFDSQKRNYNNHDYQSIVNELANQHLSILETKVEPTANTQPTANINTHYQTMSILWYTATQTVTSYYTNLSGQPSSYYIKVTAQGQYSVNDSTRQITGAYNPTLIDSTTNAPSGYSHSLGYASPSYAIGGNNTYVTFSIKYASNLMKSGSPVPWAFANGTIVFTKNV